MSVDDTGCFYGRRPFCDHFQYYTGCLILITKMDIDQEILISLVRDRPVIWDNTITDYKNKRLKYSAWKEICKKLKPNFDDIDSEGRIEFEKLVMKKWTNMKDNWIKYKRKLKESKSGAKNSRKYLYYDKMLFLEKFIEHRKFEYNLNQVDSNDDTSQNGDSADDNIKGTKRECESPKLKENKKVELTERYESSRSMNFFRGIAPTVDKFNDENMIEFQFQVISIIRNIKQRERTENTAPFSQRTHAQNKDSFHMKLPIRAYRSANKSGSRLKCRRTSKNDSGQQSGSSFSMSSTNRSDFVKVSNEDSDEHSDVDHLEYFDLPSNDVAAHHMDDAGIEIEEPVIKIEIVEDSVGQENNPDKLDSEEIKPEPGYDFPCPKNNYLRLKTRQKRKNTE